MLRFIAVTTLAMGFALAEASVPKGATEIEPGVFKHTDATGKTFIFRKTPFGIVKTPEQAGKADKSPTAESQPVPAAGSSATASPFGDVSKAKAQEIKVVERGDVLEFERPSPFGAYKWKANKKDLTIEEREAWARSRGESAPEKTAGPKE